MFHATAEQISLMVSASAVSATITTILIGALSDKIGKRIGKISANCCIPIPPFYAKIESPFLIISTIGVDISPKPKFNKIKKINAIPYGIFFLNGIIS